jgi:hypothetical protein
VDAINKHCGIVKEEEKITYNEVNLVVMPKTLLLHFGSSLKMKKQSCSRFFIHPEKGKSRD